MGRSDDGYNWIDDPFDEAKAARDAAQAPNGAALGIGCVLALALFVALVVFGAFLRKALAG